MGSPNAYRKVVGKGGLGSFIKAAFSGMMIVAGPWLMSIVGITLIQRYISRIAGNNLLFTATVIYSYAWSLVIFGGFHFIYTRIVADLLFVRDERKAAGALVFFLGVIFTAALVISTAAVSTLHLEIPRPWLFKLSAVILFVAINLVWILMIFISLLKWFLRVLLTYAAGIAIAVFLVSILSPKLGIEGSLLGFACGHAAIAVMLGFLAFKAHKPDEVKEAGNLLKIYVAKYYRLMLTGYFYNWAIWTDKVIFWFSEGTLIEGTFFRLYAAYDVAVYVANLSMIPGLIYFIIVSETAFYIQLRKFLLTLAKGTYSVIKHRKQSLLRGITKNISEQALFQSIFTFSMLFLAPVISGFFGASDVSPAIMRIVLIGVLFHFFSLTMMNYHFYFEFYAHAFTTAFLFFATNTAVSLLMAFDILPLVPGISYAAGGLLSFVYAYVSILFSGRKFDRRILAGVGRT
ncbi:MAG: exopolysaccharide Pel transporter PelG [Spirochaetales bacterium]|nr:exopolysaccharide Pel transporter PelG [Spirochaetales bacterium]